MEGLKLNKRAGIIILISIGVVFGYYLTHRESAKLQPAPSESKGSGDDSTTRVKKEVIPDERGAKPVKDPEDGSVKIIESFIKLNAKNPATFEFLEWSEISSEGGYWKVRCKYKGVASFNKEVTTNAWFYIRDNNVVYTRIISKI